jgi:hypothetical protein
MPHSRSLALRTLLYGNFRVGTRIALGADRQVNQMQIADGIKIIERTNARTTIAVLFIMRFLIVPISKRSYSNFHAISKDGRSCAELGNALRKNPPKMRRRTKSRRHANHRQGLVGIASGKSMALR